MNEYHYLYKGQGLEENKLHSDVVKAFRKLSLKKLPHITIKMFSKNYRKPCIITKRMKSVLSLLFQTLLVCKVGFIYVRQADFQDKPRSKPQREAFRTLKTSERISL